MSNQQKEAKPESKANGQGTQSRDLNSTIYQFKCFTFSSFPKDAQYPGPSTNGTGLLLPKIFPCKGSSLSEGT